MYSFSDFIGTVIAISYLPVVVLTSWAVSKAGWEIYMLFFVYFFVRVSELPIFLTIWFEI
jgi:hypothetical protein